MKISILITTFVLFLSTAHSQISGVVNDADKPLQGATVALLRAKDSAALKLSATDNKGIYSFESVVAGKYIVAVTAVGHQKQFSKIIEMTDHSVKLEPISLQLVSKSLSDVTVTAKRPLIEQRIDRTIVNVDASITNIGTSALEVLEKSPGVTVDRDGNISLKGKEGVMIMVDGRPTQLSGADLANLLRGMNSSQLDQIEIMTNPPARYDATGTSGVINIKTKKAIKAGFNGSANVAYSQGIYPKTNEGFNFNYREGKVNLFANLGHNYMQRSSILRLDRNIFDDNTHAVENIFNQQVRNLNSGNSYNAKFGVDFFATKNTTLGAVVNLNYRNLLSDNPNITRISNAANDLESTTKAQVNNESKWKTFSTNLNFRRVLDKKGREITSDIDIVKYRTDNDLFMINSYEDEYGDPLQKADSLRGFLPQSIDVYSARVDYQQPLKKNAKFDAGFKSSIVETDNDANYDSIQNGTIVHDVRRSNHFVYKENINAAYLNYSRPLGKKWTGQFGLRLENTNANGNQLSTGEKFTRHYTQLFPTAYLQYKATEKSTFGLNIGRRVSRPSYQNLNPFIRFIDRYTYAQGNPTLRPSISNNIELSHSWKNQVTTTLNYTRVKDLINPVIQQKGQETYNMPENVASLNEVGIAINSNNPVTKWWTSSINLNVSYDHYKGVINNADVDLAATSVMLSGTEQFKLNKTITFELNGMYRGSSLQGVMKVKAMTVVGAGLSKQVMKNKGTIRLSVRDIFHSQRANGISRYGNVDVHMQQYGDSRVFTAGFTYSFSKGKKIAPVKRTGGSANEEQNRIGQ
jgi:iron complex outermembrane receptor protein